MSSLWVAVTAEYDGSTFSHRADGDGADWIRPKALHPYNMLLDEAGKRVRRGLANWLPLQYALIDGAPLSDYEKLREIREIVGNADFPGYVDEIEKIRKVLDRSCGHFS